MEVVFEAMQTVMSAVTLFILITTILINNRLARVEHITNKVEHLANAMKDELVKEVREAAFAAGQKAERDG